MKMFITGVSGTGKTSIATILRRKEVNAVSIDEVDGLCNWISKKDGMIVDYEAKLDEKFIISHKWICNTRQIEDIVKRNENIIVLGMADNQEEFSEMFDKILLLQCSPKTFLRRIREREDNDFGKEKSAQKYILKMFEDFERRVLEKGAISINAENSIEEVINEILAEMN